MSFLDALTSRTGIIVLIVYCLVSIAIIVGVTVGLGVEYSKRQVCVPTAKFTDLPQQYDLEEQWFATYGSKATLNVDKMRGTFDTDYSIETRYVLRDASNENVVAQATKGYFSLTFNISRCSGQGDTYEVVQRWFNLDKVEYDLKKNGRLIAKPAKEIWFTCKPDITLESLETEGKMLATIDRSCGESFFTDSWHIQNYYDSNYTRSIDLPVAPGKNSSIIVSQIEPYEYIENYVLGFIAFLTTVAENDAAARSSSSSTKKH